MQSLRCVFFSAAWVLALAVVALARPAAGAPLEPASKAIYEGPVKQFLQAHCLKCHNDVTTRAGFRIDTLGVDFLAGKTADHWKEIYENLGAGLMPPEKEPRPAEGDVKRVMDWIDQELRRAERLAKNSPGRTRRLNRTEYFNTLRDLFYLDENYIRGLTDELPPDGKLDGFDRGGSSLYIDQSLLTKYFEIADRILTRDVLAPRPKPTVPVKDVAKVMRFSRESEEGKLTKLTPIGQFNELFAPPGQAHNARAWLPTGARVFELKNGGIEYVAGGKDTPIGSHNDWWSTGAGGGAWADRIGGFFHLMKEEGKYRMKFRAGAFAGKGKHQVENVTLQFEFGKGGETSNLDRGSLVIDAPLDQPRDYVLEIYLHPRPEIAGSNRGTLTWNGTKASKQVHEKGTQVQVGLINWAPELFKLEWELVNEHYRIAAEEKKKGTPQDKINEILTSRFAAVNEKHDKFLADAIASKMPVFHFNPDFDLSEIPRLWLESWEIEGPIVEWPRKGTAELLFDGAERTLDTAYLREILTRFLPRAFRRTVEPKEVEDWVVWIERQKKDHKLSEVDGFKLGMKAILCSPEFLLLQEPTEENRAAGATGPQPLTDFELASRLSYFLWSTMPDRELHELAAKNRLHEPDVLKAQVRRMIADPKSQGLVTDFAGQWLQVRDFGKTMTDRNEYKSYTDEQQRSSWQEPYEFFQEVLERNLSILNFVDSDFLVIDKQLADFYGIEGVKEADGFKRVAITPEHHRGGVLGMAAVQAYLSDGLQTLPVRRAAYVVDTLWNDPAKPPPPNVGDLPPVKGKVTKRQRLEQHRESASCASCHKHLDPFGMALENYDAIGRWRERQTGEGFRGDDKSPPLDVSGTLPSGRAFKDLAEYKQALLVEKARFVNGFTQKMLTYALGRSVGATDRQTVEEVVAKLEKNDYRLGTLLEAVVTSEVFRMK